MKVRIKLYAMLAVYLPPHAKKNEADIEFRDGTSITEMLLTLGVPIDQCHLVLVNGVYVAPSERDNLSVVGGDALAVWPPVAGG